MQNPLNDLIPIEFLREKLGFKNINNCKQFLRRKNVEVTKLGDRWFVKEWVLINLIDRNTVGSAK